MTQLHQVAAAVFKGGDVHRIIGYPLDLRIIILVDLLAGKVAYIADDLKVQSVQEFAHRRDGRYTGGGDHIVDINFRGGTCGGDACTVIVPEQVYMVSCLRQLHGKLCPGIALKLIGGLAALRVLKNTLIVEVFTGSDAGISLEGDDGALGQDLTEVDAEGGPVIAVVAQPQGVFAAVCQGRDAEVAVCHMLNGGIPSLVPFDFLTGKQACIADDLKIQTLPQIAFRLNGGNGIGGDHIVDKYLAACLVGGNTRPVIVPEQVYIAAVLFQREAELGPAVALKLHGGIAAVAVLKNALIVEALSVYSAVGIKGDDGAGLQLFSEIDAEGGPAVSLVTQPQAVAAAVIRGRDAQGLIMRPFKGCILTLALTGKEQFLAGSLKINALVEVIGNDLRLFPFGKVCAHQVVDIKLLRCILPTLLMVNKFNRQVTHTGKIIDGKSRHFGQVVGAGGPAVRLQDEGLLGCADVIAVFLAYVDTDLDAHILIASVVHIKGYRAEF